MARVVWLVGGDGGCLQKRCSGNLRNRDQGLLSMHFLHSAADNFGTIPYAQLSAAVWILIGLALLFDFLNGFHDAANSVATVVSTRVLRPQTAVVWAAFFNFIAFLLFQLRV